MFIKNLFNKAFGIKKNNIDASQFNDPVANKIGWEAIETDGASFNSNKIVKINNNLLEYKFTSKMILFGSFFIVFGLFFFIFVTQLIGFLFAATGAYLIYDASSPVIFDGKKSIFIKGRGKKRKEILFSEIHTLQLIPYYISNSDSNRASYYNYQINIVFKDGRRVNVATYRTIEATRKDSDIISSFIKKKVWDALDHEN